MNKKIMAFLALLALVLTAACSGSNKKAADSSSEGGKVTIRWATWGTPEDLGLAEEFSKDFMKRHPNIELKLEAVPELKDYHPKLLTQLTSKTAPDVFYVADDNIGKFVGSGVIAPLNDHLAGPDSKSKPEDFFDGLYGGAKKDGKVYGVPVDCNPEVLWYDKQALKAAGITDDPAALHEAGQWTMARYLDMNAKLKAAGLAGSIFWNWYGSTYSMINGFGGKVYDGNKFVATSDPKSRKALQTLATGYQDKTFLSADNLPDGQGAVTQLVRHKAGFHAAGRWVVEGLQKGGKENLPNYDIVPFPSETGSPMPGAVAVAYLSLNKDSGHPKEAFQFLSEFVSAHGQSIRLKNGGAVPSIKGAENLVTDAGYPAHAKSFLTVRDTGFANYPVEVAVPKLTAEINELLMEVWTGKVGFDDGMNKLQTLVDSKLR